MDTKCFANNDRQSLGQLGEEAALKFLLAKGYRLVQKNFRKRGGQIDLIMRRDEKLIFIEVKTRRVNYFGVEEDALSSRQLKTLIGTALWFLKNNKITARELQFDLVTIDFSEFPRNNKAKLRHYRDLLRYDET